MDYLTPIHQEILDTLNQSGVIVIITEHKICQTKKYDGYTITPKDSSNHSGKTQLVLCENVIQQNYSNWEGGVS